MKFRFQLMPANEIPPWGAEKGQPSLSWYGLTFGWFWIEVGDQELFRYSWEILEHWQQTYSELPPRPLPYEDYQVARYWEDLREMLPAVLHPLPDDLATRVADAKGWSVWQDGWPKSPEDPLWDTYRLANDWWHLRTWGAYHLAHPPHLWLWRVADTVHVRWDNREVTADGVSVWDAQQGEIAVSVTEFMTAVEAFNGQFLAAMREQVDGVRAAWTSPDVEIDLDSLERCQREQSSGLDLEHALRLVEWNFTWDEVREAIATIERSSQRRQ